MLFRSTEEGPLCLLQEKDEGGDQGAFAAFERVDMADELHLRSLNSLDTFRSIRRTITESKVSQARSSVSRRTLWGATTFTSSIPTDSSVLVSKCVEGVCLCERSELTRASRQGGKDAASARYIFTQVSLITRTVFQIADDNVLDYLTDDGQNIEPFWCVSLPYPS